MADKRDTQTPFPHMPTDMGMPMLAAWMEMWMWPITMMARMMGSGEYRPDAEPEIDRACKDSQLPVPNPIQKSADSDIFA
ncbi:hypothetical protein [uncultured Croceicoccus sp.]|uniref:hypothetical protein n=1 Tax=uncultured Croceicoccus sp. TaxID=1295329 RepID=UPI00262185C9|nr:hypothetical protein [uncultured Croceicoccus sp.]